MAAYPDNPVAYPDYPIYPDQPATLLYVGTTGTVTLISGSEHSTKNTDNNPRDVN